MTKVGASSGKLSSGLRRREKIDIVVGLDFGTSSTKVAYRELGSTARQVTALLFNHRLTTYPAYCLPSVGHLDNQGRFVWGPEAVRMLENETWSTGIRRLKVLVAGEVDPAFRDERAAEAYETYITQVGADPSVMRPCHVAALALAKQMHTVRTLLQEVYEGSELDLRFNVCVPIDHVEHGRMLADYHRINHVAEELYSSWTADGWDDASLLEVAAAMYVDANPEVRPDGRLFAEPEAMAEIASYLMSLETKSGIHAVIDIGAGTTDLSIFNLMKARGQSTECFWYAGRNIPRGGGYVEARIAGMLRDRGQEAVVTEAQVLESLAGALSQSEMGRAIHGELIEIWRALRATWGEAYHKHYKRQNAWGGIPVFLCGGGAKMPGAREVFRKAWIPNFKDFTPRDLPVPGHYNGHRGRAPFDRLCVAYGLTFLGPEFGEFKLPSDSPDHTPVLRVKDFPEPWSDNEPG